MNTTEFEALVWKTMRDLGVERGVDMAVGALMRYRPSGRVPHQIALVAGHYGCTTAEVSKALKSVAALLEGSTP